MSIWPLKRAVHTYCWYEACPTGDRVISPKATRVLVEERKFMHLECYNHWLVEQEKEDVLRGSNAGRRVIYCEICNKTIGSGESQFSENEKHYHEHCVDEEKEKELAKIARLAGYTC